MKKIRSILGCILAAVFLTAVQPQVYAADITGNASTQTVPAEATAQKVNKWEKNSKGFYIYYGSDGKKAKFLTKIGKKKYYFDKNGKQLNGWQKIKNSYYFFRIANGTGAYMLTGTTINGIKLNKSGKAILNTSAKKQKAKLLYNAQLRVRRIITDNRLSKSKKLRKLYDWTQKNSNISKSALGGFRYNNGNWDLYYAGNILNASRLPARGDCYTYASTFGYLANAIGYKATICSTGWHGYVRIGNKFYDPSWQKAVRDNLFAQSWNTYCTGLKFRYNANMKYTKTV